MIDNNFRDLNSTSFIKEVSNVGNEYGGLFLLHHKDKFYWDIEGACYCPYDDGKMLQKATYVTDNPYDDRKYLDDDFRLESSWEEIPSTLAIELIKNTNKTLPSWICFSTCQKLIAHCGSFYSSIPEYSFFDYTNYEHQKIFKDEGLFYDETIKLLSNSDDKAMLKNFRWLLFLKIISDSGWRKHFYLNKKSIEFYYECNFLKKNIHLFQEKE